MQNRPTRLISLTLLLSLALGCASAFAQSPEHRGKPLPPGIAKQFDGRVQSRLPSYPGYDWRQVGTDAVLIDATTGIVEAIIANVLQ